MRRYNLRAEYLWHCHHIALIEQQNFLMADRVKYIRQNKDLCEQHLRLMLFRKAKIRGSVQREAVSIYRMTGVVTNVLKKLHKEQCVKDCPWTKEEGILTRKNYSSFRMKYVTKTGK